jgi:hypothetical protein
MKALLVIVLVLATAAVANASQRYGQCLEKRVIAKHGYAWAVNHAGSTVCDR